MRRREPKSTTPLTLTESSALLHVMTRIAQRQRAKQQCLERRKRRRERVIAFFSAPFSRFRTQDWEFSSIW